MRHSGTAGMMLALVVTAAANGSVIVNYTVDAGGDNPDPLNGMTARGTFDIAGTMLTITMRNTSTGVPTGADFADSILVSLGFDLPDGVVIGSGESALIATGSTGVGSWSGLGAGDSVADEWLWTNDAGGDLLASYDQIISTSNGQGGGTTTGFDGNSGPNVDGPSGGMVAAPPLVGVPGSQPAVSDAITFTLTLSDTLTLSQLQTMADSSIVEFGSDFQYLTVPAPGAMLLLIGAPLAVGTRRRRY